MLARNPLRARHTGVQSANPVPPDVDAIFHTIMGRGLRPEENEGIHTALYASISIEYAITAAEADGSKPVLVTIDKTGLSPQLDAEGIAIKRLLSRERPMLVTMVEMIDAEGPKTPEEWIEAAHGYYEYADVNPIAILSSQFWRPPEVLITHLKSWLRQPSDAEIMAITGSQRYLEDISLDHIVAIEELVQQNGKLTTKPLYTIPGAQESSPQYQYHGTTLAKIREAFRGELSLRSHDTQR